MAQVYRTKSGKRIYSRNSKRYAGLFFPQPLRGQYNVAIEQSVAADLYNAIIVRREFADYTQADHVEIARWHEDVNDHRHAGAHYAAAGYHRAMDKGTIEILLGPSEYLGRSAR